MPHAPRYVYDATHADSVAALSRLGRASPNGAQTVGVFRYRGAEPVRIERLGDNTFVATRLDEAGRRRNWVDRLLDIVRALFGLEGGTQWKLAARDCREMESSMFALSARAMQGGLKSQREWAAMRERRGACELSPMEVLPLPLLHAITARLGLQDHHTLRRVCSTFASSMAACVPLLRASSWTTLSGLHRAVADATLKMDGVLFAAPLDRSSHAEALARAASRISVLPTSELSKGVRIVLEAIKRTFPDGDGSAKPLSALGPQFSGLLCVDRDGRSEALRLAHGFCSALERLPLADRLDPAFRLDSTKPPIVARLRSLLIPDSCWVLAVRTVPPVDRPRVIDGLAGLLAESSRLPPSRALPMARQALELAEFDPTAAAHALAALIRMSSAAMLTHGWLIDEHGAQRASGAGEAVWGHLFARAMTWPATSAAILVDAMLRAMSVLPDQDVKCKVGHEVHRWLQDAVHLPASDRREIETLLFGFVAEHARIDAWITLWDDWASSQGQGDVVDADARRIATCLTLLPDARQWESILLPRLGQVPPHQRAAVLANVPAYLYTGPHTRELFDCVLELAVCHRLIRPLTLWYRARSVADYQQYSAELDSALICLPRVQQAEWISALSVNRVMPPLWIDLGLAALNHPLPRAALEASLIHALASQFDGCTVTLDDNWQARVAALTRILARWEGPSASLDVGTVKTLAAVGNTMLQWHEGMAQPGKLDADSKADSAATVVRAFVDIVWRLVQKMRFLDQLVAVANLCASRFPFALSPEDHFHPTTVRHAIALLPALSPRQRRRLLPMLIDMESGLLKGARPVDWRGFDDCRQTLWQAIATLPGEAPAGLLDKVSRWFAHAPADVGSRKAWAEARRQYRALVDAMRAQDRTVLDSR